MKLEKGRGSRIKTVGELSVEQRLKEPYKVAVKEFGEEVLQKDDTYMKKLWACVQNGLDVFEIPVVYVEVHGWKERAMDNVINYRMKPRVSCPTPTYGQAAWKFDNRSGKLEILWQMSDRETCISLLHNAKIVDPLEKKSLKYALEFYNGTLDRICHQEDEKVTNLLKQLDGTIIFA